MAFLLFAKGARAFVSFVRSYSKHEAAYIFRLPNLNLQAVARSFALLIIPRMPEVDAARKNAATKKKASAEGEEEGDGDVAESDGIGFDEEEIDVSACPERLLIRALQADE